MLEDYQTERTFDVATLRMVAEHVADPARMVQGTASIAATVRSGGDLYGQQSLAADAGVESVAVSLAPSDQEVLLGR
jgi:hypothetical protein